MPFPKTDVPVCRLLLVAVVFIGAIVFVSVGAAGEKHFTPYLCSTSAEVVKCYGPDDLETCADLIDPTTGAEGTVTCVESSCGHLFAPKIDISVSGASDPLGEGTPTDVRAGFMIMWSLVPYALFVILFMSLLFTMGTSTLSFILLVALVAIVNEFIFKKLISQPRPTGSCMYFAKFDHGSYGMPSGHAATSIVVLANVLLEIWVDRPDFSLARKGGQSAAIVFFLSMVPFSRVYLHDHTPLQVGVGAAEGLIMAGLWFVFTYFVAKDRLDGWIGHGWCTFLGFRNDYRNDEPYLPGWAREWMCSKATPPKGGEKEGGDVEDPTQDLVGTV